MKVNGAGRRLGGAFDPVDWRLNLVPTCNPRGPLMSQAHYYEDAGPAGLPLMADERTIQFGTCTYLLGPPAIR